MRYDRVHFDLPTAFCLRCRLRQEVCLCGEARAIDADMRLILVLHSLEARKMSNTGHLAALVIPDTRIAVHGHRDQPVDLTELNQTHAPNGRPWRTLLMFPGLGARELTPDYAEELRAPLADGVRPRLRLVVPDGTWRQARRMVQRLPELNTLPRIILPVDPAWNLRDKLRPRGNPQAVRTSTCEAIASAVATLASPEAGAALFDVYDAAALRIALMRGKLHISQHRHVLQRPTAE